MNSQHAAREREGLRLLASTVIPTSTVHMLVMSTRLGRPIQINSAQIKNALMTDNRWTVVEGPPWIPDWASVDPRQPGGLLWIPVIFGGNRGSRESSVTVLDPGYQ